MNIYFDKSEPIRSLYIIFAVQSKPQSCFNLTGEEEKMQTVAPSLPKDALIISEVIYLKNMSVASTGLSYRIINSWENQGLIDTDRINMAQWRKFSFIDFVWIRIIADLRTFGFPLEKLLRVKEALFNKNAGGISLLVRYIYSCAGREKKVIKVYNDGDVSLQSVKDGTILLDNENFVCLDLRKFISDSLATQVEKFEYDKLHPKKRKSYLSQLRSKSGKDD